MIAEFFNS